MVFSLDQSCSVLFLFCSLFFRHCFVMEYDIVSSIARHNCVLPNLRVPRDTSTEGRTNFMEEGWRRESFGPSYGVYINPISEGKQIPLCSSGQGCSHQGGSL